MLNKVAEVGASFDWITPLCTIIQDVVYGPAHHFLVPMDAGWSGREIEQLLRSQGVQTWGLMVIDGLLFLSVRERQARWAQHILLMEGIPIAKGALRGMAKSRSMGGVREPARAVNWLDRLSGTLGL